VTEEPPCAKAYQAIGEYFCAFSALERELGEVIKVILRLQEHEARDIVVAGIGDVSKKISLVQAACLLAKNKDGSEMPDEWRENSSETVKRIWTYSDDRNHLAHSFLKPKTDGSVDLTRLRLERGELKGKNPSPWTVSDFKTKVDELRSLTLKLQTVKLDLSTLRITIPITSGLFADASVLPPRHFSPAFWAAINPHSPGGGTSDSPLPLRAGSDKAHDAS
jgi:hypothetical protein